MTPTDSVVREFSVVIIPFLRWKWFAVCPKFSLLSEDRTTGPWHVVYLSLSR